MTIEKCKVVSFTYETNRECGRRGHPDIWLTVCDMNGVQHSASMYLWCRNQFDHIHKQKISNYFSDLLGKNIKLLIDYDGDGMILGIYRKVR